jgi:hypothetical protein
MDHQKQFEELPLLRAWSAKLCLTIVGPWGVRNHLLKRMRADAIRHIEMARELAALRATVTSTVELVLGHLSDETFWVEIMDELVAQFRKLVVLCSRLEWPSARIYDLLLGLPPDQALWADRLDEATGQLEVGLTTWWQADTKLWDMIYIGHHLVTFSKVAEQAGVALVWA